MVNRLNNPAQVFFCGSIFIDFRASLGSYNNQSSAVEYKSIFNTLADFTYDAGWAVR